MKQIISRIKIALVHMRNKLFGTNAVIEKLAELELINSRLADLEDTVKQYSNAPSKSFQKFSDEEFIDFCYTHLLGWDSVKKEEKEFWIRRLKENNSKLEILYDFLHSKEFISRLANNEWAPPGHYYSVIPSSQEIEEVINGAQNLPKGIDLHDAEQLQLLENLGKYYCDLPFTNKSADGLRYYYDNLSYSYSDAILLFCMIRYLKPQRIIEVGSGYTSCLMLDTNEKFFNNSIDLTFIEPYPQVLESLVQPDELSAMNLIKVRLQDIDLSVFDKLERSDILFIDSSHVVKCGSDLRYLFSEVLSSLRPGVVIHFHDIFYPFEMLAEWLKEGRYWNENYFLATFLQHNSCFKIILFSDYLHKKYPDWFKKNMPLCLKCRGGNIWLQKM